MSLKKGLASSLIPCLLLSGCGASPEKVEVYGSGAKSAVASIEAMMKQVLTESRPSAAMGIFVGIFVSQGTILPTQGAMLGVDTITKFLEAHLRSDTDENFALLREVGAVLQVDIVDTLNRSTQRSQTLDEYTKSLKNVITLSERKIEELDILHDRQKTESREKRNTARDIERSLRTALKDQDYAQASDLEQSLAEANSAQATIETKTDQTKDMMDRFESLLEVAQERYQAVTVNREILVAGLKVIDVPGISDLNILEKGKKWNRRGSSGLFN